MKKAILAVVAFLLAGPAAALTVNRVVKASSSTYITNSQITDDGTTVMVGTSTVGAVSTRLHVVGAQGKVASFPTGAENLAVVFEDNGAASLGIVASSSTAADVVFLESGSNNIKGYISYFFPDDSLSLGAAEANIVTMNTSSAAFAGVVESLSGGFKFPDGTTAKSGPIFTSTASVTVTNTVTTTTLLGAGVGSLTLPANFWTVGKTVRVNVDGYYSTDGTAPGSINFLLKNGSVTISSTSAFNMTTYSAFNFSNEPFNASFNVTCRSVGASGTLVTTGGVYMADTSNLGAFGVGLRLSLKILSLSETTIDTTSSAALDFQVHWDTADTSNIITQATVVIDAVAP
jgi:hypothetical protein